MKENENAVAMAVTNRRPRSQSLQQVGGEKSSSSMTRDCCSSGSFVSKLYRMVDSEPPSIVSWIRGGTAFCIVDPKLMAEHCLPKYFRHRRFSSLIRQLNFYSFYRVQEGQLTIYQHSFFRKGRPDLLVHIKRRGAGKAKDPWFDPLASANKLQVTPVTPGMLPMAHPPHPNSAPLSLPASSSSSMTPKSNPITCYSPMAKPLTVENMSPALKPGVAQVAPPIVELNHGAEPNRVSDHKGWNDGSSHSKENEINFATSLPLSVKTEFLLGDVSSPTVTVLKSNGMGASNSTSCDIDVQDFLTEDCTIHSGVADFKNQSLDRYCGSNPSGISVPINATKCATVARDCLKFRAEDSCGRFALDSSMQEAENNAIDEELLRDLANVEPGTWEVPLSPLNDEEDVMPWLDLCF